MTASALGGPAVVLDWFEFHARNWLDSDDVTVMPLAHQGAYLRLLARQWVKGTIPTDRTSLAAILALGRPDQGLGADGQRRLLDAVLVHFEPIEDAPGRLANRKLEEIRARMFLHASARAAETAAELLVRVLSRGPVGRDEVVRVARAAGYADRSIRHARALVGAREVGRADGSLVWALGAPEREAEAAMPRQSRGKTPATEPAVPTVVPEHPPVPLGVMADPPTRGKRQRGGNAAATARQPPPDPPDLGEGLEVGGNSGVPGEGNQGTDLDRLGKGVGEPAVSPAAAAAWVAFRDAGLWAIQARRDRRARVNVPRTLDALVRGAGADVVLRCVGDYLLWTQTTGLIQCRNRSRHDLGLVRWVKIEQRRAARRPASGGLSAAARALLGAP